MVYFSHQKDELNKEPKTGEAVVWKVGGYGSSFLFTGKLNNFSVFRFLNCKMGIIPASLSQRASLIARLVKNPRAFLLSPVYLIFFIFRISIDSFWWFPDISNEFQTVANILCLCLVKIHITISICWN